MSTNVFKITSALENELTKLDFAQRMLNEASHVLAPIINFDKSKEDEERIRNLLNRREALEDFVDIATDYIVRAQETLRGVVDRYSGGGV